MSKHSSPLLILGPCQNHTLFSDRVVVTYNASMAAEALAMLTSLSWPPASCHNPLSMRGISSDPPIFVLSGRTCVFEVIVLVLE